MFCQRVFSLVVIITTTSNVLTENNNTKVVVIGAGLAGLTTAYRLQQQGIDVAVYEARSRVGGRVFTVNVAGEIAELGGANIPDGGAAENMRSLIKELGLEITESSIGWNHYYFDGEKIFSVDQLMRVQEFHPQALRKRIDELMLKSHSMQELLDGILEKDSPLYKTLALRLAIYEGAAIEKVSAIFGETLFQILCDLDQTSSANQDKNTVENKVKRASIKGGNALLPEKMAVVLGSQLHLSMPLVKVSKDANNAFLLTFQGGQQVSADILVLAIPCATYDNITFAENVIPPPRLSAIKSVQSGAMAKLLIPFARFPMEKKELLSEHVGGSFEASKTIFTLYYGGEASKFSSDTILNTYCQDRSMLEIGFGDACPPFSAPVFACEQAFASYDGPVGYSWSNDSYAKGCYSYIAAGQDSLLTALHEEQGEKVKTLFAPIDQRLYFAGEHTSITKEILGTMEAACESGERAARMIRASQKL